MDPITITLHNRTQIARVAEPVAIGVPFARGALVDLPSLAVTGSVGETLPTQVHTLLRWDDDSVKFALVQFPASVDADSTCDVRVVEGEAPEPDTSCRVVEHDGRIEIDTGPAQFTVRLPETAGIDRAVVDGHVVTPTRPPRFFMQGVMEPGRHMIGRVESVEVEERGPFRVLVRLHGVMLPPAGVDEHFRFELAMMAYAGQRAIRAQYTFVALDTRDVHPVERIGLRLVFESDEAVGYRIDADPEQHVGELSKASGQFHAFRSVDGDKYYVADGGPLGQGRALPGRAVFSTQSGSVGAAIRDFAGMGPGGFRLGWDKADLAAEVRVYDGAQKTLRLGQGRSRTHDVLWQFRAAGADAASMFAGLAAFQRPLVPSIDPAIFCATGAFGRLTPSCRSSFPEFDRNVRESFERWQERMAADPRNLGIMDYGDFASPFGYGGGVGIYMDQEYDPAHGFYLQWTRTGDPDYFEAAGRLVRHFIDVDVHQLTGHQQFHRYPPIVERHEENPMPNSTDWGHVFNDSAVDHYLLTGDRRARRIACQVGLIACDAGGDVARHGAVAPRYVFKGAERTFGWPVITLARTYELTRDERCLEAMRRILEYLDRFSSDPWREYAEGGRWWRTMMHDGCKPFMVGLLMEGFCRYHTVSGEGKTIEVLTRIADWLIANMWNDEAGKFEYELNAYNAQHRVFGTDDLMVLPLMVLYAETRRPVYLHVLRRMVGPKVERFTATQGTELGMVCRATPHFLAMYEDTLNDRIGGLGPFRSYVRSRTRPHPARQPIEEALRVPLDGGLAGVTGGEAVEPRVTGSVTWVAGPDGRQAAHFAVADGRGFLNLSLPDHAAYPCPPDTLLGWGAAGLWVRHDKDMSAPGDPDTRPLLYIRGREPKRDSLLLCLIYNELRVRLYDSNGWLCGAMETPLADLEPGTWHHYAVAWQPGGLGLYVDGEHRAADSGAVLPDGPQAEIYLGWCDGNWFAGLDVADLWLARGAVGPADVSRAMAARQAVATAGPA